MGEGPEGRLRPSLARLRVVREAAGSSLAGVWRQDASDNADLAARAFGPGVSETERWLRLQVGDELFRGWAAVGVPVHAPPELDEEQAAEVLATIGVSSRQDAWDTTAVRRTMMNFVWVTTAVLEYYLATDAHTPSPGPDRTNQGPRTMLDSRTVGKCAERLATWVARETRWGPARMVPGP